MRAPRAPNVLSSWQRAPAVRGPSCTVLLQAAHSLWLRGLIAIVCCSTVAQPLDWHSHLHHPPSTWSRPLFSASAYADFRRQRQCPVHQKLSPGQQTTLRGPGRPLIGETLWNVFCCVQYVGCSDDREMIRRYTCISMPGRTFTAQPSTLIAIGAGWAAHSQHNRRARIDFGDRTSMHVPSKANALIWFSACIAPALLALPRRFCHCCVHCLLYSTVVFGKFTATKSRQHGTKRHACTPSAIAIVPWTVTGSCAQPLRFGNAKHGAARWLDSVTRLSVHAHTAEQNQGHDQGHATK